MTIKGVLSASLELILSEVEKSPVVVGVNRTVSAPLALPGRSTGFNIREKGPPGGSNSTVVIVRVSCPSFKIVNSRSSEVVVPLRSISGNVAEEPLSITSPPFSTVISAGSSPSPTRLIVNDSSFSGSGSSRASRIEIDKIALPCPLAVGLKMTFRVAGPPSLLITPDSVDREKSLAGSNVALQATLTSPFSARKRSISTGLPMTAFGKLIVPFFSTELPSFFTSISAGGRPSPTRLIVNDSSSAGLGFLVVASRVKIVRVAVRCPLAVGLKTTLRVTGPLSSLITPDSVDKEKSVAGTNVASHETLTSPSSARMRSNSTELPIVTEFGRVIVSFFSTGSPPLLTEIVCAKGSPVKRSERRKKRNVVIIKERLKRILSRLKV